MSNIRQCFDCSASIKIHENPMAGEIVACPDCGESYELIDNQGHLILKKAEQIGEDWGQ